VARKSTGEVNYNKKAVLSQGTTVFELGHGVDRQTERRQLCLIPYFGCRGHKNG